MSLINTLREKMGKVVIIFIGFSLLAFILTDLFSPGSGIFFQGDNLGEIDGEDISREEFQAEVDRLSRNFSINNGRLPNSDELVQVREEAWQSLVYNMVFQTRFNKLGLLVTNEELVDMVQGENLHPQVRLSFQDEKGEFDLDSLSSFLRNLSTAPPVRRIAWDAFESSLAPARLMTKYENLVQRSGFASRIECGALHRESASRTVDYLYVPFRTLPDSAVSLDEKNLGEHFRRFREKYSQETSRDLEFVSFKLIPSENDTLSTREQVENLRDGFLRAENDSIYASLHSDGVDVYSSFTPDKLPGKLQETSLDSLRQGFVSEAVLDGGTYKMGRISKIEQGDEAFMKARHILIKFSDEKGKKEARRKAARILLSLRKGEDFAALAREHGTDGTASKGGDLGWFGENGSFTQDFKDACFAFKGTGLLNAPVETEFGFHIIDVTSPKTNNVYVAALIERSVDPSDQTINTIYRLASSFRASFTGLDEFKVQADTLGYKIKKAASVKLQDQSVGGIAKARGLVLWLFNAQEVGEASTVFELQDQFVVAVMTGKRTEGEETPEDVREQLERDASERLKAKILIDSLSSMEGDYKEMVSILGKNTKSGSATFNLGQDDIPGVGRAPKAIGTAFSLEIGEFTLPFEVEGGIMMMTLKEIKVPEDSIDYENARIQLKSREKFSRRNSYPTTYTNIYNSVVESMEVDDRYHLFY